MHNKQVRVNSSPIANLSREVNEAAVTERSRKAEVLKMVEAMTIHEQCKVNLCNLVNIGGTHDNILILHA